MFYGVYMFKNILSYHYHVLFQYSTDLVLFDRTVLKRRDRLIFTIQTNLTGRLWRLDGSSLYCIENIYCYCKVINNCCVFMFLPDPHLPRWWDSMGHLSKTSWFLSEEEWVYAKIMNALNAPTETSKLWYPSTTHPHFRSFSTAWVTSKKRSHMDK